MQSANYAHIKFKRGGVCWKYGGAKRTHYEESCIKFKRGGVCWKYGGAKRTHYEESCIKFKRGGMCWKYGGAKRTHYEESTAFVLEYNRRKDYCNLITPPKNQSASVYLRRDKKEIDYH